MNWNNFCKDFCKKLWEKMRKNIMLGTSDAWSMSRSSQQPSDQAYYIEDCLILRVEGRLPPCTQVPDGPVVYVMYYGNGWEHYNDVEGLIVYRLLLCGPPSPPCPTVLHNVRFFNFSIPIQIMCCISHTQSRGLTGLLLGIWNCGCRLFSIRNPLA